MRTQFEVNLSRESSFTVFFIVFSPPQRMREMLPSFKLTLFVVALIFLVKRKRHRSGVKALDDVVREIRLGVQRRRKRVRRFPMRLARSR
jgi:hypothetical protein